MPANEDCYEPADETVFEVWATTEICGSVSHDWLYTQVAKDEAESIISSVEEDASNWAGRLISVDIYETTRLRVGGKVYGAPGEVAE